MSYDLSIKNTDLLKKKQSLTSGKKLTLKSTLTPKTQQNKKTYILADISGSMNGEKMDALKQALHQVWRPHIHGIAFESEIWDFEEKDINSLHSKGSTNMLDALYAAWDDLASHIILITDGQPDQSKPTILQECKIHSSTPIDTIGIGDGRFGFDEDFLSEISNITGGRYNSINEPLLLTSIMEDLLQISEKSQVIKL